MKGLFSSLGLALSILLVPVSALLFMWGWSMFAPIFKLPSIDYWPAFGITLCARVVFPATVVGAWGDR